MQDLAPGDTILLNDNPAEVIKTYSVGNLDYLRAYVEDVGVKTVCIADVDIEPQREQLGALEPMTADQLHPDHDAVSAEWFDLRSQALQLQIAHEQGQLLSISNSLVRLEPYQLACVNWVMQKLRQRALIADDVGLGKPSRRDSSSKSSPHATAPTASCSSSQPTSRRSGFAIWTASSTSALHQLIGSGSRANAAALGEETNIWDQDHQQMVTSMAFLRQEEFREELDDAFWDVVVVDEAHKAAKRGESPPSKTSKMVERVADNSDSLLLLSATPHDGKGEAFRSLIEYIDPFLVAEDQDLSKEAVDRVMMRRGKQRLSMTTTASASSRTVMSEPSRSR